MRWPLLLVALAACGDNIRFLPDALIEGDPPASVASPAPGVFRGSVAVTLTADEDATIYYTLDGTTPTINSEHGPSPVDVGTLDASTEVRFYAVDRDNDHEEPHAVAYVIDRLGPPAVAGATTSYAGFGLDVRWTAPVAPGFVDVVVAETADVAATIPTFDSALAVGDAVGAGTVVYAGTADHLTIDTPIAGSHTFVVWARYDTGTYSEARVASAYVDPAGETAQLTFDTGAVTGGVITQPPHATIAVGNVAFNAGTLTFDLTATSGFVGLTNNAKLVATAVTGGAFVGDGTLDLGTTLDLGYLDLGPEAWAEGAAVTRSASVTGAAGTVTIELAIHRDRGVYATRCACALGDDGGFLIDPAAGAARAALPRPPNGFDGERYISPVVAADGRHVLAGTILPSVVSISPTDGAIVATYAPDDDGEVTALRLDGSGQRLYVLIEDLTGILVELDPGTLVERRRVDLQSGIGAAPALELSRDGRWAAVIATEKLHLVELSAFAARDADPTVAGVQAVPLPDGFTSDAVAFDAGGALLVVNAGDDVLGDQLGLLDLTDAALRFTVIDADPEDMFDAYRIDGVISVGGVAGGFWLVGDLPALTRYNLSQATFVTSGTTAQVTTAGRLNADGDLDVLTGTELGVFDTATGTYTTTATLPAAVCDRTIAMTPY